MHANVGKRYSYCESVVPRDQPVCLIHNFHFIAASGDDTNVGRTKNIRLGFLNMTIKLISVNGMGRSSRVDSGIYFTLFFSVFFFFFFCCGEFNCLESDFADRSCLLLKTSIMNDKTQKDGFTNRSRLFPLEVLCISVSCGTEASTRVVLFCFNYSSQNRSDTRRETSPVTSGPASPSAGEPSDAE